MRPLDAATRGAAIMALLVITLPLPAAPPGPTPPLDQRFVYGGMAFRHPHHPVDLAVSPDGTAVAVLGFGRVDVLDRATGATRHSFPAAIGSNSQFDRGARVAFSPNGRLLALAPNEGPPARVWDLSTGKELPPFGTRTDKVRMRRVVIDWAQRRSSVRFAPGGRLVAS